MAPEVNSTSSEGISKRVSNFFAPCSRFFNRLRKKRWCQNSCCLCNFTWTISCSWVCCDRSDGNCNSRNIPGAGISLDVKMKNLVNQAKLTFNSIVGLLDSLKFGKDSIRHSSQKKGYCFTRLYQYHFFHILSL